MDVVFVGSLLVYGKLIYRVGGLQYAVCKAVWQVKCGESPYLCGLLYGVGSVVLAEAEELQSVCVVAETDNI